MSKLQRRLFVLLLLALAGLIIFLKMSTPFNPAYKFRWGPQEIYSLLAGMCLVLAGFLILTGWLSSKRKYQKYLGQMTQKRFWLLVLASAIGVPLLFLVVIVIGTLHNLANK
jgi:hypothetical protein